MKEFSGSYDQSWFEEHAAEGKHERSLSFLAYWFYLFLNL